MQKETSIEHLPSAPQLFEQHSSSVAQELPDVLHEPFSATQALFVHLPPQHWLSLLQVSPSEMHAAVHFLLSQRRPQHSVAEAQASPVDAQVLRTEAQVLLSGSHTPEQQSVPPRQISLKALHDPPV